MRKLDLRRQSVVEVAVVAIVLLAAALTGLLDGPELSAVNLAFRLRGPQPASSPVVIVAIDDQSFAVNHNLQWPWPRTYFAQMLDRLIAGGAKTVVFDVFFTEPEEPGKPSPYTVQGDSLKGIADRFGVTIAAIVEANGPDFNGRLCPGQVLNIPTTSPTQYTISIDSIVDIAARYQVDAAALMALNQIEDVCDLLPAQLLLIPADGPVSYRVEEGDALETVAALFQVNPLAVLNIEGQPVSDPLTPGQTLSVQFGDAALAASIQAGGNVVLVGAKEKSVQAGSPIERLSAPIGALRRAMAGFGLANIQADVDGVVHSVLAWDTALGQVYYSWPIVAASVYGDQALDAQPGNTSFQFGARSVSLDNRFIPINYRGPEATLPTYSAHSVVNGDLPLETFKDKIVLIGATAESLKDTFPAPFDPENPMPAVEIMGNVIDTLLSGQYLYVQSGVCLFRSGCPIATRAPALLGILLAGVAALALTTIRRPGIAVIALVSVIAATAAIWLAAFVNFRTEIPFVAPEIALFVGFVIPTGERAVTEELAKRRVRGIFERFISPEMVEQLVERGIEASRGRRAELTILFSDIRGFTTMSEKMTPEEVVNVLNEYLDVMTEIILKHGGTVDKYEGDLIMAFFGAPIPHTDHARRAVLTALDMRQALDRLRAKWAASGGPAHFEMGIGLNTGEVFVGLLGSSKRINYTVIGDAVNLASRLQDLTKDVHWPLLISEFTYEKIKDEFDAEFAEERLVKGKTQPVGIYKVLGRKGAPEAERVRSLYA